MSRPPAYRSSILRTLARGSGLDAPTLAERLGYHPGFVRRALSKLSLEGMISRNEYSPNGRPASVWRITEQGRAQDQRNRAEERATLDEEMYA